MKQSKKTLRRVLSFPPLGTNGPLTTRPRRHRASLCRWSGSRWPGGPPFSAPKDDYVLLIAILAWSGKHLSPPHRYRRSDNPMFQTPLYLLKGTGATTLSSNVGVWVSACCFLCRMKITVRSSRRLLTRSVASTCHLSTPGW